jgi:AcrR family transcriptional regulator
MNPETEKQIPDSAEKRILDAARAEFVAKGLTGARMQSIAHQAGVNKALIHYYYRSKLRLYEAVLDETLSRVWTAVERNLAVLPEHPSIDSIVRTLVATYINTLKDCPSFPRLILRELADGGENVTYLVNAFTARFGRVSSTIFEAIKRGVQHRELRPVDPAHILVNIIGMCAASFILKPVITQIYAQTQQAPVRFDEKFYASRITAITEMALGGIIAAKK